MWTSGPRIRASHTRLTLDVLSRSSPSQAAAVLAALPPEVREGLARSGASQWVPAGWDAAVTRALRATLGATSAREIARAAMVENMTGTLLAELARATHRLFGASPAAFYRWAGRAWAHLCRDFGTMNLERCGEGEAVVILSDLPEGSAEPGYLDTIAAGLEAILEVCEVRGDVQVEPAPDGGRFVARWRT